MIFRLCLALAFASAAVAGSAPEEETVNFVEVRDGRLLKELSEGSEERGLAGAYNRNGCYDATYANNYTAAYAYNVPYTYLSSNSIYSCNDDLIDSYDGGCPTTFGSAYGPIWFYIIGQGVSVRAHSTSSNYDTRITVYRGSSCGSLACVDYNDDHGGGTHSSVTWLAEQGVRYYIRLDDYPCKLFDRLDDGYNANTRVKFDLLGSAPGPGTAAPTPAPVPTNDYDRICGPGTSPGDISNFLYGGSPPAGVSCACVDASGSNNGYSATCSGEQVTLDGVLFDKQHVLAFDSTTGDYRGSVTTLRCASGYSTCASVTDRAVINLKNETNPNQFTCLVANIESYSSSGTTTGCRCDFCGNGGISYSCFGGSNGCQAAGVLDTNPFSASNDDGDDSSGVSIGVIVGAAAGGLVLIVCGVVGIWCCLKNRNADDESVGVAPGKDVEQGSGSDTSPAHAQEEPDIEVEDIPDENYPPAFAPGTAPQTAEVVVTAPAGPLGLTMGTRGPNGGHLVDVVKSTSPMLGVVMEGDEILKINDVDLTPMDMKQMTETLRKYAGGSRELTLVRSVPNFGTAEDLDC